MSMDCKISQKLSNENLDFLRKLNNNINTGTSDNPKSYSNILDIIYNYFKNNNESYLELVKFGKKQK